MSIHTHQKTPDIRVMGHWLYLKKCLDSDVIASNGETLIIMPDHRKDYAELLYAWWEVIARGPLVGTSAKGTYWTARKRRGYRRILIDAPEVGERVLAQGNSWRFKHSPYAPKGEQIFMDETIPMVACDANDKIRILQDFILLELIADKHEGGITEPDEVFKNSRRAKVIEVNAGEIDIEAGNTVLIPNTMVSRQLTISGKTYELVQSKDILASIEETP